MYFNCNLIRPIGLVLLTCYVSELSRPWLYKTRFKPVLLLLQNRFLIMSPPPPEEGRHLVLLGFATSRMCLRVCPSVLFVMKNKTWWILLRLSGGISVGKQSNFTETYLH